MLRTSHACHSCAKLTRNCQNHLKKETHFSSGETGYELRDSFAAKFLKNPQKLTKMMHIFKPANCKTKARWHASTYGARNLPKLYLNSVADISDTQISLLSWNDSCGLFVLW